jgi:hypothetical protein
MTESHLTRWVQLDDEDLVKLLQHLQLSERQLSPSSDRTPFEKAGIVHSRQRD